MLEIEIKARVESPEALRNALHSHGFVRLRAMRETDTYYNGVDRSFAETDEALRLRVTENLDKGGERSAVTYKGPKLDSHSQTRAEHEVGVQDGGEMHQVLLALGHTPVLQVQKRREYFRRGEITACVDEVSGLGSYMELETLSKAEDGYEEAVELLFGLLDTLGIPKENCTRKSYLEMLLESADRR